MWSALADMTLIWSRYLRSRARRRINRGGG
jgi:hypothetical protein